MTVGVTVIVAVTGVDPEFKAVKPGIFPVPLAPKPIEVLLLVQVKEPPFGVLTKLVVATAPPLHTVIFDGTVTVGVGFTMIVYVDGVPLQPLAEGVTVIVATMGALPVLVAVNDGTFPVPLVPSPIAVFELAHANDTPDGVPVKLVAATVPPLHTEIFDGTTTVAAG